MCDKCAPCVEHGCNGHEEISPVVRKRRRSRKRLRLSLGPRQVQRVLLALSYAKDAVIGSEYDEDEELRDPWSVREAKQYDELREVIFREIGKQHKRGRLFLPND